MYTNRVNCGFEKNKINDNNDDDVSVCLPSSHEKKKNKTARIPPSYL